MTLITESVRKNAAKCHECIVQKIRDMAEKKNQTESHSVLYENTKVISEAMARLSCNLCPNKKDFEKIYGMSPSDYYSQNPDALETKEESY